MNKLYGGIRKLLQDEAGVGSVWAVYWLVIIVGISGLAVDITNARRTETMLQSTADAAALAGAMDLPQHMAIETVAPDIGAIKAAANQYAERNLSVAENGHVLLDSDIAVGAWDAATRSFNPDAEIKDAVMVATRRSDSNENAIGFSYLRILSMFSESFDRWNVGSFAIAQRYIPDCLRNGLVAAREVDMSSLNHFTNDICIHGQEGVDLQSGNTFDPGVTVSMPDVASQLTAPASAMTSNTGLTDALMDNILQPRQAFHVDEIIQRFVDKDPLVLPDWVDPNRPVVIQSNQFSFKNAVPGSIYLIQCRLNKQLVLPSGVVMDKIVLIADCQIILGANSTIKNSVIASRSGPNPGPNTDDTIYNRGDANITAAAGVQIGAPDGCANGGGVLLLSNATMTFSSTTSFDGVQLIARGDISLGARAAGINGISAQSGSNIYMTSTNMFGLCHGGVDDLQTVDYYRLVR